MDPYNSTTGPELLRHALEILEQAITIPVKPGEGEITLTKENSRIFGFDHTLPELTPEKLHERMLEIADLINQYGSQYSIPLEKPLGVNFADNAVGKKVWLRLVTCYDISFGRFIARFDCFVAVPVAAEVAA